MPVVEAEPVTVPETQIETSEPKQEETNPLVIEKSSDQSSRVLETITDTSEPDSLSGKVTDQSETKPEESSLTEAEVSESSALDSNNKEKQVKGAETGVNDTEGVSEVRFSLSDAEGETELEEDILNTKVDNTVPDTEENLDIEHDLSALAADVLGTKTHSKTD